MLLVAVLPGFAVGGARHYPYVANSDFHQPKHLYSWKTLLRCEKHWPANQAGPAGLHERAGYPPAAVLLQAPEPSRLGESETQRLISKNWASTRVAVTADEPATPE